MITLAIAVAILRRFNSPFEKIVIDILVLIYVTLESSVIGNGLAILEAAKIDRARFFELMKVLGSHQFESKDNEETIAADNATIHLTMVKLYIKSAFTFIIFSVAIWDLIHTI